MAIIAHVSVEGGGTFPEVLRSNKSPAVWGRDDLLDFVGQLRSLIRGRGEWRWSLETSAQETTLVVESAHGTVRSGPLVLSKDLAEPLRQAVHHEQADQRRPH